MKRIIHIALAACLALSTAACASGAGTGSISATDSQGGQNEQTIQNAQDEVEPGQTDSADALEGGVTGEITVSAYDSASYKTFLEEAATAFQAAYPDAKVNVSTFSAMPEMKTSESGNMKMKVMTMEKDVQAEQDYINKINTELMSGGGADVLAMDIIPYYQYAESGQLVDLNTYMDTDGSFNKEDYRQNILQAIQYKGGQYIFPLDYSFDYFAYDSSLFSEEGQKALREGDAFTYEQLIAMGLAPFAAANSGQGEPVYMFGTSPQGLFNKMFRTNYGRFVDVEAGTAAFNNGEFSALLNTVKSYADEGYIQPGNTDERGRMNLQSFEQKNMEQFLYKAKFDTSLLQHYNKNTGRVMMFGGGTNAGNEENDEIAGSVSNEEGEKAFTYNKAFGVNANSANKDTAWAFIKFLAGTDMQSSLNVMGTPVNQLALAEKTKQSIVGSLYEPGSASATEELNEEQMAIFDGYMAKLDELSDALNVCYVQDQIIDNAVDMEIRYFFDGSKTAEEVADVLQNKIELYLNE